MKTFKEFLQESKQTITTVDGVKAIRPGTKHTYEIVKEHGSYTHPVTKEVHRVFSVKQPNGFHGFLVTDKDKSMVINTNHKNQSKEEAHEAAEHYSKNGLVGMKGYYSTAEKIVSEESLKLDEVKLSPEYYEKLASYHDADANLKNVGKNVIDNAKKMSIRAKEAAEMIRNGRSHDQAYRHYQGLKD